MLETIPTSIGERVMLVQAKIAAACHRAGRNSDAVTLVAISKKHSAERIVQALEAGIMHMGENRIEEAIRKMPEVARLTQAPITWHMVGDVQSRKARYIMVDFTWLHSLSNIRLAEKLSQMLVKNQTTLNVLLEMNVSGEATKQGWPAHNWQNDRTARRALWDDVAHIVTLPGLHVRGLMTMAPIVDDPEATRPVFVALRELRDALAHDYPAITWSELSMGMTDDYPVAIEEGATLVRIGRAIFGPRT